VKVEKVERKETFYPNVLVAKQNLHRIAVFDQRGPPAWYLGGKSLSSSIN
jgi:hypothetical protein